jgi:hypothetical protein
MAIKYTRIMKLGVSTKIGAHGRFINTHRHIVFQEDLFKIKMT